MNTQPIPHWKKYALTPEIRESLIRKGVLRYKTMAEIKSDCMAIDERNKAKSIKKRKSVEKIYTDKERLDILAQIHGLIERGVASTDAAKAAGITYNLFLQWRKRYGIKEPELNGEGRGHQSKKGSNG